MIKIDEIPDDGIIFYDIETNGVYPTYCDLFMVSYQLGIDREPVIVDLHNEGERQQLASYLADPNILKVTYNGINFDDIVLFRHGFYVEPVGRHDMFLALKTVAPFLASYGLKFANLYFFGDWHEPERRLFRWLSKHSGKEIGYKYRGKHADMYKAPEHILAAYCKHDVKQTAQIFRLIWEVVQREKHWKVYTEMELAMANPLHEMVLLAGEWVNPDDIVMRMEKLWRDREKLMVEAERLSGGKIKNAGSALQVSNYMHDIGIELELSESGHYSLTKDDLIELIPTNPIAKCIYDIRDISKVLEHYQCYLSAARHERTKRETTNPSRNGNIRAIDLKTSISKRAYRYANGAHVSGWANNGYEAIPKGYTLSSARTRRFQSRSRFGINFQNQNKRTKVVQLVPPGWLDCYIDSTQIENVVHIWASQDDVRRESYEADPNWSEYVWVTNTVLGTNLSRKELEAMPSKLNPRISVYKQYKQIKLALNFFMGVNKFVKQTGLDKGKAQYLFNQVHEAVPAIRNIGNILRRQLEENDGYVVDPFGHIYYGNPKDMNQLIAYYIQGCGTGSVPKAMTVANYASLHAIDSAEMHYRPCIRHPYTRMYSYAAITGTTHDECAFRISLGLPEREVIRLIRECLYNMEQRFSPLFDNIPLRAKLAVSITNASEQEEIDHRVDGWEKTIIENYIRKGKKAAGISYHSGNRS